MKKFFKLGKRMMALFSIAIMVLLNINSYAAVGANDGSAFVTEAEFDALVNTFNEQMDTYTSGLNAKIDGAIANYLGGLSNEKVLTQVNLYNLACEYNANNALYRFFGSEFVPEETKLSTTIDATGELTRTCTAANGYAARSCNIYFSGNKQTGDSSYGRFYSVTDYGGLERYSKIKITHMLGGSYLNPATAESTVSGANLTPNIKEYGSYNTQVRMMGMDVTSIAGFSKTDTKIKDLEFRNIYNKISENETYFIEDKNKNKVLDLGTLNKSGQGQSAAVRGVTLYVDLQNCTMSGSVSYTIKDPYYTKSKASNVVGNEGASRVLKRKVLNYEGCPIVKCDNKGTLRIVFKWTTNLTDANFVQTGINKTGFTNGGACVIDPQLTTDLPNNVVEAGKEITINIKNVKKDDIIWMKGIPVTGQYADLDIISVSIVQND